MPDGKEVFRTPTGALTCSINDMEQAQDGGRVMLALANESDASKELYYDRQINGVSVVVNYLRDKGMDVFPTLKEGMLAKRYTLILIEEQPPA